MSRASPGDSRTRGGSHLSRYFMHVNLIFTSTRGFKMLKNNGTISSCKEAAVTPLRTHKIAKRELSRESVHCARTPRLPLHKYSQTPKDAYQGDVVQANAKGCLSERQKISCETSLR